MRLPATCLALICLGSSPSNAALWSRVPFRGHLGQIQIDMDSLTTALRTEYRGLSKHVWMRRLLAKGGGDMAHVTIDCDARTYFIDSAYQYSMAGSRTKTYDADASAAPIPPDTDFDAVRLFICPS